MIDEVDLHRKQSHAYVAAFTCGGSIFLARSHARISIPTQRY
jgi:hypothetical protein